MKPGTAEKTTQARKRLLQMHYESRVGHIGGNLSCLDSMMVVLHHAMAPEDSLVLSKGHSAGALYVCLWSLGKLSDDELKTFHKDGTRLSGHPPPNAIPDVMFGTGSLGHGLSLAAGVALGRRLRGERGRVFCVMSDGEWQEGSNWEALIFLIHHRLPITIIVDANGLQGFGETVEIASQKSLAPQFRAHGISTIEVDGHDQDAIAEALLLESDGPHAVVARTRKGNGVSFMENRMEWHYLPLTDTQYEQAVQELANA
jgi:transketolase